MDGNYYKLRSFNHSIFFTFSFVFYLQVMAKFYNFLSVFSFCFFYTVLTSFNFEFFCLLVGICELDTLSKTNNIDWLNEIFANELNVRKRKNDELTYIRAFLFEAEGYLLNHFLYILLSVNYRYLFNGLCLIYHAKKFFSSKLFNIKYFN